METQTELITESVKSVMEHQTEVKTIRDIIALNNENKIILGAYYQRSEMASWKKPERTDALLDSILHGWHIQPIHCRILPDGRIEILDGKQRFTALFRIYSGDATINHVDICDDLDGKIFSMFPETWRERFLNYQLELVIHTGLDDEQVVIYFERLQKGIPLSAAQARRGEYVDILRKTGIVQLLEEIDPTPTKDGKTNYEILALQIFTATLSESPAWKGSNYITDFCHTESGKLAKATEKIKIQLANLQAVMKLGKTDDEFKKAYKRMMKKVHVPIIIVNLPDQPADIDKVDDLWNRLAKFFALERDEKTEQRRTYDNSATSDSASYANIKVRTDTMRSVLTAPLVKEVHKPAEPTDATAEKLAADAEYAEKEKAKAQKALNAKIEQERKAKAQAQADIKEDAKEQPKSKFLQRKEQEQRRNNHK